MKKIMLLYVLFLAWPAFAQQQLSVGDQLPDNSFKNLLNYKKPVLKFSDFQGKLMVLEFTNPRCGGCIKSYKRLLQLKKQLPQLEVILVTSVTKKEWNEVSERNKIMKQLSFPVILGDTVLHSLLPHYYVPHLVWLDASLKIMAITDEEYLTTQNINLLESGYQPDWLIKKDPLDHDFSKPLLRMVGVNNNPAYYSICAGHMPNVNAAIKTAIDSSSNTMRYTIINQPLLAMFRFTLTNHPAKRFTNRIMLEVADQTKLTYDTSAGYKTVWTVNNTWCYESLLPLGTTKEQLLQKLRSDLEAFFGYTSKEEKRWVNCYVIKKTNTGKSAIQPKSKHKVTSMTSLVYILNLSHNLPVIDETGIEGDINLPHIGEEFYNIGAVKNMLQQSGLMLSLEQRELDMFVITDKKRLSQ